MKILTLFCLPLLVSLILSAETPREEGVRQASIIFSGVVDQIGASALKNVPASESTIIVRVNDVIAKPPLIGIKPGYLVTIRVAAPGQLKQGDRALFYCSGWIIGEGLALIEIGHDIIPRVSSAGVEEVNRQVRELRLTVVRQLLRERLDAVEGVFLGRVIEIEDTAEEVKRRARSEHDPDWEYATVKVEKVVKLWTPFDSISVRFPGSTDIAWADVPKLVKNEEDVLLVRRIERQQDCVGLTCATAELVDVLPKTTLNALFTSQSAVDSGLSGWQVDIESCINSTASGAETNCPSEYPFPACIGNGGRRCLMAHAAQSAKDNNCSDALKLVLICQCHDLVARQALEDAGEQAICDYLRSK